MTQKNYICHSKWICIFLLIITLSNTGRSQKNLQVNITQDLANTDTLVTDSLKLWTLFHLAGGKYGYARESRPLLDRCREIALRTGDPIMMGNYQYAMGNYFFYNSQPDSSTYFLEKALQNQGVKDDPFLHSQILATQSGIQKINGQISQALETKLEAKEILAKMDTLSLNATEKIKRVGQMSILNNSLGILYQAAEDYEMAISYYQDAYDLLLKIGDHRSAGAVMGNIGEMHLYTSSYDKALEALNLAMKHKESAQALPRSRALTLFNIGRAFKQMGKSDTAMVEFNRVIEIFKKENHLSGLMEVHLERGLLHLETGEYESARQDCKTGLDYATSQSNLQSRSKACECLYRIHKNTGNHDAALVYYEQHVSLRDSIFNAKNIKQLTQMEMQYNFDRERDLQRLEADVKQREYQRVTRLLIAGILVSLVIAAMIFYFFRMRKKALRLLGIKNAQISKALDEKEVLLKEIHHRVKNNLQVISSLLSLQSRQLEDTKAKEAIQSGRNRVKSMALIHQKLYQDEDLVGVDVPEYIDKLTKSLVSSYQISSKDVKIYTDVDPVKLDVDTIIPIGLILNELISNSLKYAFDNDHDGIVEVSLKQNGDGIKLKVSDNGEGLPETFSIENSRSLGYRLIKAFADKLKATLSVECPPNGTSVSMLIPNPKII